MTDNTPAKTKKDDLATTELPMSQRFMQKVVAEFGTNVGEIALTNFQKRLAQNYFMAVDTALRAAEEKRLKKTGKYQDALPVTWANVNLDQLTRNVVACARISLDPAMKNHINMMPFKNNALKKYDIVFIEGYRGIELKAVKYGLDVPDKVIVELVYTNDKFTPLKKDLNNACESYAFEIGSPFDRGEIVGGFYYHIYSANPDKNKLVIVTADEILKRRPKYASPEFWGGEKDHWEDGKKKGKEKVEGWVKEMYYKTIYRMAFGAITIDSQKIDDAYLQLKQMESSFVEAEVATEIAENANGDVIDITPEPAAAIAPPAHDPETGEVIDDEDFSVDLAADIAAQEAKEAGKPKPGF